jgi:uncharacterized membrane protein YvbJ
MKTNLRHQYITDEKGKKTSVVIDLRDYKNLMDYLEDHEDAQDLLKAEREATGFIPHEIFRKKLRNGSGS